MQLHSRQKYRWRLNGIRRRRKRRWFICGWVNHNYYIKQLLRNYIPHTMHLNVNYDYVRNYMLSRRQFMICGTSTIVRESASCYFVSYVVLYVLTCITMNKYPCVVLRAIVDFPKIINCRRSIVVSQTRSQIGAEHELN